VVTTSSSSNRSELIVSLAKVLIAAAWADGQLDTQEVNVMKDLLFRLPRAVNDGSMQYTAVEWAEIEMYIEAPVEASERARLIDDLQAHIRSGTDKELVVNALDELVRADGAISPEDEVVIAEIRGAIDDIDHGFFSQLSRLLVGPRARRSDALAAAPNRERYMDEFINNKVYYGVRRRLELGEAEPISLDETRLRRLSALGGILARIAQVDGTVTDEEFARIVAILQENWALNQLESTFVTEVAVDEVTPTMDAVRLVRDVYSAVPPERADELLDLLFQVADADGYVTDAEIDAIYSIARALGLSHRQFIEAKLRIPTERRAS
jgi:uncharacterized tellurite resistance protein B-like protein